MPRLLNATTIVGGLTTDSLYATALRLAGASIYELKNVIGVHSTNFNGAAIIHTSIPRAATTMFRVHVKGWIYSPPKLIDFIIIGYAYNGQNGTIDGVVGRVIQARLWDFGTDGLTKRVGVDAAGNVALAIGDTSTALGSQFLSLGVDAFTSHSTVNYLTGWSIDFYGDDSGETDANFGWGDITTPISVVLADIELDGATLTTGTIADARLSANVLLLNTTRTANTVLAGPTSGTAAPTFRALVAGDIPALAYVPASQVTGGGIVATGGFTLTVPATGIAALLARANAFSAIQSFAATVVLNAGMQRGYVTKTANYTITDTDDYIAADATGGSITMTLPSAVGRAGRIYTVRRTNSGTNTVSVATVSSQTILGGASPAIINIAGQSLTIMSDGANWVYAYQ
jgi:hypothetical protein